MFSCLIMLSSTPVVFAQSLHKPLLTWLPLLTSNLKRFQPNQHCPQNQIVNIQANKEKNQLDIDIGAIDWDLDCQSPQTINSRVEKPHLLASQKDKIEPQINALFELLAALPEVNLRINSVNLDSTLLENKFAFSLFLKKTRQTVFVTMISELLNVKLKINLHNKQLSLESVITLDKLPQFIKAPTTLQKLLNNKLELSYVSDLNSWQKGAFTSKWQGELSDLAESVQLNVAGDIELLTELVNIEKFDVKLNNVSYQLSQQQDWHASYIKLRLSNPAVVNASSKYIQALPLQLRVGRSELLTKVLRGEKKRVRIDKQKLPPLFSAFRAQGSEEEMLLDWRISLLNQTLNGKVVYADHKIKAAVVNNQVSAKTLVKSLHSYLPSLDLLEMNSGDINLQIFASYDLNKKIGDLKSTITALDIAGKNNDLLFDGVSLSSELDYLLTDNKLIINQDKQQLKIANLFVGIPVQSLQLDAQVNAGKPLVDHFKARLLGGRIDFDDFNLSPPSQTLVNISGVSLSEVMKYSAYPEIKSKAIIDGVLPLSLTSQGPNITNGVVFARPPGGYIKVPENTVIKAMGRGNPAFSYTMQLLSNFQFDTLQGGIGYTADGEGDFKIELKGISPNISGTQAITFNYSHQENILKLLESLRFNDQLVQQIEENY